MPQPHEIFSRMSPSLGAQLLSFLQENEKPLYKATVETLAKQRKLRPVFLERMPREERHAWIKDNLGKKQNESVAAHLLQIWLVSAHRGLLCDFLDALEIKHDENGTIETLPPAPEKAALRSAVETCLSKHDLAVVVVYLNAFQALDEQGWSTLAELIAEDPRLQL